MSRVLSYLFLLVVLILSLTFTSINVQSVQINYFVGSHEAPLALVLGATLIVGALFGALVMMRPIMRLKLRSSKLRRAIRNNEKEISILRTLPLKNQ
ncbi:MAG TPA: LapA family protein [Gammaproteobacteria bacterium]|nr:LapA family protein [Gammaproteobacteria bacterium]